MSLRTAQPLLPPEADWQAKVARAFSRAAPRYDALANAQRHIGETLWRGLPYTANHILDLGCGTGYWSQRLATRYATANVTGLDIAPGMLEHARAYHGDRIIWQQGSAEALPLPAGSFDLVFSNLAIQWCRDSLAVMRSLYRVLTSGGKAFITTLLPGTLAEIAAAWQRPDALLKTPERCALEAAISESGLLSLQQSTWVETFFYPDFKAVMASIKGVGAQVARPNAALTRADLAAAAARFEQLREPRGLPVTYHCLNLQLEKP
ncbi:methyltransferase domain-containing protein [Vreelandella nanhaiensis]|uniref:Methyltransferase domain-containing protein n=1 Tax=Vreelandella nanhaiensis TaxID=1258546 RepID=A0A3S0YAS1_9GAMM|nr:methyltransferase domain-containing protein [Halomonas nanhaiensis]RUR34552.1 methyltransferase domain-containing protein [Halomonas nanhaiensis]